MTLTPLDKLHQIARRSYVRLSLAVAAVLILLARGSGRVAVLAQAGGCLNPPNVVVTENCQPGHADWDLTGGNDPTIQGFASGFSVNQAETVDFKINTDATNYQIDIYRLGYYGGAGARKITAATIALGQPQVQPDCATDPATGLVDCGTWATSASWSTAGQTSGIFLAKLTRIDNGVPSAAASHIVFVVRDDSRHSNLLFQTSDTTWQAYNRYGGNSLYYGGPGVNPAPYINPGRAYKVSYNRPFDTRDHDPQSWLFNAEYPMVRWLEANGYDVSYFAGVDSDRSGALIKDHKAFLSVGHDEYWSATQRANVEAARDAGVHLAFFSGNEMFWKARWEASIDGMNTSHRTLVSYKETLEGAKIDPNPAWTGTWRDARFSPPSDGGRPENGLTGTMYTVDCCSYAITVPAEMGAHRFWRNTGIGGLTPGSAATLTPNSLGYEWDEDLDNGFRPLGLTRLSSTTVDVPVKFGSPYSTAPGTATHSLTLYRKNTLDAQGNVKSALVFGAGTVQWSWGLDGTHDRGGSLPDSRMQQATVNLLADMGLQPGTIQTGLSAASASTDAIAPISTILSLAAGASAEAGGHLAISGTATDVDGVVAGVEVSVDGGATWRAASGRSSWTYDWSPAAAGVVAVMSRATDDSGNIGSPSASVLVSVRASTCPCGHLWNPATAVPATPDSGDQNAIEVGVRFSSDIDGFITAVRFYKSAQNTGTHIGHLWTNGGTLLASGTFTNESSSGWQELRFAAAVPILANTTYVASYHTNVGHYSGDSAYFATSGVSSPPLRAPVSGAAANGVFIYGASAFPTASFKATNYWVDVTFAESVADNGAPSITQVRVNALDGSNVVVSWKTNEDADSRVEYSTDQFFTTQTFSVENSNFVLDHSLTITGLTPNNTYYFRITSVDRAGNPSVFLAPSFTVPGPTLHDTAPADFLAGSGNTYVSQNADGEVTLSPAAGAEFYGSSLPAGWKSVLWNPPAGSVTVGGGLLTVDGARVGTCDVTTPNCDEIGAYGPDHSLEFVTTFTGDPFQHAGLSIDLNPPWALFSTGGGSSLVARTHNGGDSAETPLGTQYLGTPHRYRIDWTASSVNYFVDGVQVATHAVSIGAQLRPIAASDFNPMGGNIVVDWIRMLPYATSGSFASRVFDAGSAVDWASIYWTGMTPAGTSLAISERTGDTPTPDASWTAFAAVAAPGEYGRHPHARYVQYRADLATSDPSITPELRDIIISTDHAPVAVNDQANTNMNVSKTFSANPLNANSLMFNDGDVDTPKAQLRVVAVSPPAHGIATINPLSGAVTYTPLTGYTGADSFTYTISDGLLISNAATVSITVGNRPPVAGDDGSSQAPAYVVNEDSVLSVAAANRVTANDSDPDAGDSVTAILVAEATHGHVTLNADGSFTYTPNADTSGPDQFSYQDRDSFGALSNIATVFIDVTPVNDAPSFSKGGDQAVLEDAGAQTMTGWASAISAGPNEAGQALDFIVSNDNNALFSVQPAVSPTGTLTYRLASNMNGVNHVAHVTVRLHDDGGTANGGVDTSGAQTFIIRVTPTISIGDVMLLEGDSGTTTFAFPVTLSGATDQSVVVSYSTLDGTATVSAGDYQAAGGMVAFAPGVTTQFASVLVNGDTLNEDDETFTVTLFNATGAPLKKAQGTGVILNDDPVPSLTIADASRLEGNSGTTNMTFTVTISHVSAKTVNVNYATANGSAVAPADYVAQSGTLTFAPGTPTQTIAVPVVGNTIDTPNKTFVVNLSGAVNATITSAQATGTIIDDDTSMLTYTTAADFSAATLGGSYISQTADGEIILAPTVGTEFSGTSLPAGWISTQKVTGGTVTVSNGTAKLQGTQISTTTLYGAGRSVEFAATFNGAPQQSAGLLLAQFYTQQVGSTVNLYATTVTVPPVQTLIPGNWFNASHKFRIDWNATSIVYWIDGAKVATHNVTFPAFTKMSVIANDFWKSDGVITIDWMRLMPYAASDAYTSNVVDAGAVVTWLTLSWSADKPTGTNVVVSYRTGDTPTPDATWTAFRPASSSGSALSGASRYFQYMIEETTTAPGQTPAVKDVTIGFNR
jgi:VCBS repeat-containing protein